MSVIVVVDDRVTNRNILAQLARAVEPQADVHAFDSARIAYEWMIDKDVDLIITDFQMPEMNGAEFVRECRRKLKCFDVPIIVITAYEDRDYRYSALEAGATDFLRSPIDHHEFRTRAINLLTMWRQKQIIRQRALSLENELRAATDQHARDLRQSEEKLRNVIDTVPALVRASDADGHCVYLNSYHKTVLAFDATRAIGQPLGILFDEAYGRRHRDLEIQIFETGRTPPGFEERLVDRHGISRQFLTTKAPLCDETGATTLVVTVSLDITERARAEENVRKLSMAVEQSPASVLITNTAGEIEYVNAKFTEVTGYRPEEVIGRNPRMLRSSYTPAETHRAMWETIKAGGEWRGEFYNKKKNGELYWEFASVSPIKDAGGEVTHYLAVKEDITVRKKYEEQVLRQANYDDVTRLPNRVLALDRLSQALARAHRQKSMVGLLFIDLDRFKVVNDTLGHSVGDRLLKEVGQRLSQCTREGDTVARLGGDEFTVVLPDISAPKHAEVVAEKILEVFAQPIVIDGQELFTTASIGITLYPLDAHDPHALMRNADAAMYQAKELGRNRAQFFTRELNEQAMERVRIETHLRHALERDEMTLHYQPIVDLKSGRLVGAEALLRWHNEELGNVPPGQFIPMAEDTGQINIIGAWVIKAACRQAAEWRRAGAPPIRISANVSSRQFRGPTLIDAVTRALSDTGLPADDLDLEITEGLLMEDLPETTAAFERLTAMGVRFSVDDFGTGFSSLSYLKRFPVTSLKIDRSFIEDVTDDADHAALVGAIITMAHSLKLLVVAEGVETPEQMAFVKENGCDFVQGYFVGKPMPADVFWQLLKEQTRLGAAI
ncbi:GGDEF/EAL domain-containing response regulator [Shumkonia mesophila]|uniref:GGDEF/EAL domain-containing response regulator n=1 Tax=Shumkonia mesophila TaxID=2838854 RepID=UPI0029347151|nr:EAL domain-containing protein [Shumkonia mesophila]